VSINPPSFVSFIGTALFLVFIVVVLRAFVIWILKINSVLTQLQAIGIAVGVPEIKHAAWPLRLLRRLQGLRQDQQQPHIVGSANDGCCKCCGAVLAHKDDAIA
jgi:hypothetical protein